MHAGVTQEKLVKWQSLLIAKKRREKKVNVIRLELSWPIPILILTCRLCFSHFNPIHHHQLHTKACQRSFPESGRQAPCPARILNFICCFCFSDLVGRCWICSLGLFWVLSLDVHYTLSVCCWFISISYFFLFSFSRWYYLSCYWLPFCLSLCCVCGGHAFHLSSVHSACAHAVLVLLFLFLSLTSPFPNRYRFRTRDDISSFACTRQSWTNCERKARSIAIR